MRIPYWQVEPDWAGETVVILGGGPSLDQAQVDACRGRARVIAVNTSYWLAPWADILYFSDECWWTWHYGGIYVKTVGHRAVEERCKPDPRYRAFAGMKVALANAATPNAMRLEPALRVLQNYDENPGFCDIRDGVYTGRSSGAQAIQLARHLGAARAVLLGFDMRAVAGRTHWHMAHHRETAVQDFRNVMLPGFQGLARDLPRVGLEVLNATPGSAIDCFPRATLAEALKEPCPAPGA